MNHRNQAIDVIGASKVRLLEAHQLKIVGPVVFVIVATSYTDSEIMGIYRDHAAAEALAQEYRGTREKLEALYPDGKAYELARWKGLSSKEKVAYEYHEFYVEEHEVR